MEDGHGATNGGHVGSGATAGHGAAFTEATGQPHGEKAGEAHDRLADVNVTAPSSLSQTVSPMSPRGNTPNPFSRHNTSLDLDDYFTGPRDMLKHSKWPLFFQMHGSIMPKMIVPLLMVACWATLLTCVHELKTKIHIESILLTVLGFVVGLGLSFRSSTAYERYAEGRKYWTQLVLASQNLGRVFWIHTTEREGELGRGDILAKLTALNLITAFAVALKHKLRYEPYTNYDDISYLISHLDTYAQEATEKEPDKAAHSMRRHGTFKNTGEYLGISFAESNPRKAVKKAGRPLGNLPLEILSYMAAYTDEIIANGQLPVPMQQTLAYNNIAALNDVLTGSERVLTTPLPIAYAISITQITWVYIIVLPFQLLKLLNWITIPASVVASYIILGILFIGREIENPFGRDVNDLPLEAFCGQVASDMDIIASRPKPRIADFVEKANNRVLWPLSSSGWPVWMHRGESRVRQAVRNKVEADFEERKAQEEAALNGGRKSKDQRPSHSAGGDKV